MTLAALVALSAATLLLAGMSWTIQLVHYPLFAAVDTDAFPGYHRAHTQRIATVVVLPWAVHGVATAVLLLRPDVPHGPMLLAAVAAVTTVAVTFLASIPSHEVLADGFDDRAHRRLVRTNWLRTGAWSVNAAVALWLLADHVAGAR